MMTENTFRLMLASDRRTPAVLPDNTGPNLTLRTELQVVLAAEAEQLGGSLADLRRAWQPAAGDSDWERVAPSLVVGWILGHVGALQFLRLIGLAAAAVDLTAAELERMVVLSFLRVSPENGVAHLLGGPYADGWQVRQIVSKQVVRATLASADAEGVLLIAGGSEEPLRQLNAYTVEGGNAFYPGTYRLTLPVLSAASLSAAGEQLTPVCQQLQTSWSRLVNVVHKSWPVEETTSGQWLRFYSSCLTAMVDLWVKQQLLPPVAPFQLERRFQLFGRRQQAQLAQSPCGLCFWRDVDALWELGQQLASGKG
jgi:hypothetical protein